jgi:hypothetical protein
MDQKLSILFMTASDVPKYIASLQNYAIINIWILIVLQLRARFEEDADIPDKRAPNFVHVLLMTLAFNF